MQLVCQHLRFFTLNTTLPHHLIKEKPVGLIERTCNREWSLYFACNDGHAFFTFEEHKRYAILSCQTLTFPLDIIYIRFGTKLYRKIMGILFVADLVLFLRFHVVSVWRQAS